MFDVFGKKYATIEKHVSVIHIELEMKIFNAYHLIDYILFSVEFYVRYVEYSSKYLPDFMR
jgi:hypothetical protein